jgi:hypothetical protein
VPFYLKRFKSLRAVNVKIPIGAVYLIPNPLSLTKRKFSGSASSTDMRFLEFTPTSGGAFQQKSDSNNLRLGFLKVLF